MPFRDFDAARKESERGAEPITFVLGGETFSCIPKIPLAFSFELMESPEFAAGTNATAILGMTKFLRRVLVDDDNVDRFDAMLGRRDNVISADEITEVVVWLGELYSGRPLANADDSGPSPSGNGHTSSPPSSAEAVDVSWNSP